MNPQQYPTWRLWVLFALICSFTLGFSHFTSPLLITELDELYDLETIYAGVFQLQERVGRGDLWALRRLMSLPLPVEDRRDVLAECLIWAAYSGQTAIVRELILNGVDLHTRVMPASSQWAGAITVRFETNSDLEYARPILCGFAAGDLVNDRSMREQDAVGVTAIMAAAAQGHRQTVWFLLEYGADAEDLSWRGVSPLMLAALGGHTAMADFLAERGAEIDRAADNGVTALMLAAKRSHSDTLRLLLDLGADPNARSDTGHTALMASVQRGDLDSVWMLLERGADVSAATNQGLQALDYALREREFEAAEILVLWGADPGSSDRRRGLSLP